MFGKFIPKCKLNTTKVFPRLLRLVGPSVQPWNCNPYQIAPRSLEIFFHKFVWTWITNCCIFRVFSLVSSIGKGKKKKTSKKL
jgi:hypothetical protein